MTETAVTPLGHRPLSQLDILDEIVSTMAQAVVVFDEHQQLIAFNQQYVDLFEYPQGYVQLGMPIEKLFRFRAERGFCSNGQKGDVEKLTQQHIERAKLRTEHSDERNLPNGKVYIFHRKPMAHGWLLITYTDITERKEFETALTNAKEEAQLANRTKSEFLANTSHELRTPLNAIIGFSEVMLGPNFNPNEKEKFIEYIEGIYDSGQHLLAVINDILDISKIDCGKQDLAEEKIRPVDLVSSCVEIVKIEADKKGLDLIMEIPDEVPELRGDRRKLRQILLNLLSNAIKFTPDGGKITVELSCEPSSGHIFRVVDTGIGVAPKDIGKIFDPFSRIENPYRSKTPGTGLGLALVRKLTELHGGSVSFESSVGEGSTVTVRFPPQRMI